MRAGCPAAQAALDTFSRNLGGHAPPFGTPASSVEDPVPRSPPPGMLCEAESPPGRTPRRCGPPHPSGLHATPSGCASGGETASRQDTPAQSAGTGSGRCGGRCQGVLGRDGVRSACTVPHTVPASFREAHVGRCPGALPGSRTRSRWVCGSIPAEGPRRGKRSEGGFSESPCEDAEIASRVPTGGQDRAPA
jgi:hypothetical protein